MEVRTVAENVTVINFDEIEDILKEGDSHNLRIEDNYVISYDYPEGRNVVSFTVEITNRYKGPRSSVSFTFGYDDAYTIGKLLVAMSETYHMYDREAK